MQHRPGRGHQSPFSATHGGICPHPAPVHLTRVRRGSGPGEPWSTSPGPLDFAPTFSNPED